MIYSVIFGVVAIFLWGLLAYLRGISQYGMGSLLIGTTLMSAVVTTYAIEPVCLIIEYGWTGLLFVFLAMSTILWGHCYNTRDTMGMGSAADYTMSFLVACITSIISGISIALRVVSNSDNMSNIFGIMVVSIGGCWLVMKMNHFIYRYFNQRRIAANKRLRTVE
jgi:uncharacterized membrane protein